MKHPKNVEGYTGTIQELVEEISRMDYSAQVEFLTYYGQALKNQSEGDKNRVSLKDKSKNRIQLASKLEQTSQSIFLARDNMISVEKICKPYT